MNLARYKLDRCASVSSRRRHVRLEIIIFQSKCKHSMYKRKIIREKQDFEKIIIVRRRKAEEASRVGLNAAQTTTYSISTLIPSINSCKWARKVTGRD
jgi:hypothetical protein